MVDGMQTRQAGVHGIINRPPIVALELGKRRVPQDPAIDEGHEIEGGADNALVFAERERARRRIAHAFEGLQHAELALDHMGHLQELARRLAAQHVTSPRGLDQIGRVRLSGREFLDRGGAAPALDMGLRPRVERARIRGERAATHCDPASLV